MGWTVELHQKPVYVIISFQGIISERDLKQTSLEAMRLAEQHGTWFILCDCTDLEGGHSVLHIADLVPEIAKGPCSVRLKEALILPRNITARDLVKFWVTTCWNYGIQTQAFDSQEKALLWLLGNN